MIVIHLLSQSLFYILKPIFYLFVGFEVSGLENLREAEKYEKEESGVILATNHTSELDVITVGIAMPFFSSLRPLYYVSREREFYSSGLSWLSFMYGGIFFKMCAAYPAYPGHHDYGFALSWHLNFLRKGRTVCIFPEGKRVMRPGEADPKGGVSYLAETTNSVIVPTLIYGTNDVSWYKFFMCKSKVKVIFGKPIYPNEMEKGEFKKNARKVMEDVYSL